MRISLPIFGPKGRPIAITNLRRKLSRRLFLPGNFDWIFNPVYLIRKPIYEALKKLAAEASGSVLDFGCGSMPYRSLFVSAESYVGIDLANSQHGLSNPDLVFLDGSIPLPDRSVDVVVMFEVLDDLPSPQMQFAEIYRVLKPGGRLIATSSFVWEIHEEPFDYYRYTDFGISRLLTECGLKNVEVSRLGSYQAVVGQLIAMYWYQTLRKVPVFGLPISAMIVGVTNGLSLIAQRVLPTRQELYHTNLFTASKSV